jgi:hypothetical protein
MDNKALKEFTQKRLLVIESEIAEIEKVDYSNRDLAQHYALGLAHGQQIEMKLIISICS